MVLKTCSACTRDKCCTLSRVLGKALQSASRPCSRLGVHLDLKRGDCAKAMSQCSDRLIRALESCLMRSTVEVWFVALAVLTRVICASGCLSLCLSHHYVTARDVRIGRRCSCLACEHNKQRSAISLCPVITTRLAVTQRQCQGLALLSHRSHQNLRFRLESLASVPIHRTT